MNESYQIEFNFIGQKRCGCHLQQPVAKTNWVSNPHSWIHCYQTRDFVWSYEGVCMYV